MRCRRPTAFSDIGSLRLPAADSTAFGATGAGSGRCGFFWRCSSSPCSPNSSPTTGRSSSAYDGAWYFPVLRDYPETTFGGDSPTKADYRDPAVMELIDDKGLDGLAADPVQLPHDHSTAPGPAPAPPSRIDWLGTDDQGRDVLARLIYGFRISVLFGLALTCSPRSSASPPARCRAISAERRSRLPALYRDLGGSAGPLSADHPGELCRAEFLVAARA